MYKSWGSFTRGDLVFQFACHFHRYRAHRSKSTVWPKMESCFQDGTCSVCLPSPVFLPEKSHGQKWLASYTFIFTNFQLVSLSLTFTRYSPWGLRVGADWSHLACMHIYGRVVVLVVCAQPCPTLFNPMDCSPPCSSVRGIFQARRLEWVDISDSRIKPVSLEFPAWVGRFFTIEFFIKYVSLAY